ncbi:MAG: hypothetical protein ACRDAU_06955 [Clostridium sp.]
MGLIIIEIILGTLIISTYAMIVKKFWALREYLVYKVVSILNMLYICNMILNLGIMLCIETERVFRTIEILKIGIVLFLIGNIILILTYNRSVKKFENKNIA